ncbi:ABC transporter permease [Roseomonas marmotae]|uniref:ABC transporter permease n=1 Tax=Roseomonas marmotae TaxID=2768161 RepID=A0ABS3K795_9PROT|nr:ABC transporter permease [Roseomonas marmotae]MBO1073331.1 ABC transporter permease [Roseomonas marmotae]QTI79054.1 ABC transporter permease [Roseomonas marmotae]
MAARGRGAVLLAQAAVILALFLAWEVASQSGLADARLLPPPSLVVPRAFSLMADESFRRHLWVTIQEVSLAVVIAAPLGVGIGLVLAESPYLGRAFKPFFHFIAAVPKSVFLPVFILLFGIGFGQKVAFGVFQALFVLVIATSAAVAAVPRDLLRLAHANGATRRQIWTEIYWNAMLPLILEGLRLGMIFNIAGVIFAEMYVSRAGLGQRFTTWGETFQMPELFAGVLIAAALSIIVNETLRALERRAGAWRTA